MMQLPRETYKSGGLSSLREARDLLEKHALPGESLAYINDEESKFLKYMGGAGIPVNSSGIPSYFKKAFRKITKPIAKVLDKIVPNEIKPALPFVAAALPFMLPTTGFFASAINRALTMAAANAGAQLAQEGAEKYGINPISVGLAGLGGYLSAPGTGGDLAAGKIIGNAPMSSINPELAQFGDLATQSVPVTQGMITSGAGIPTNTDLSLLQKAENVARGIGEYGAETFQKADTAIGNISSGNISLGDVGNIAKAGAPGMLSAAGDKAYLDAQKALDDYNQQQQAIGQLGVANTEARKAAVRRAMGLAGYTEQEIEGVLPRLGLMNGGYLGYQDGGLMSLKMGGMPVEMDFRARGGFVPIGKKERADDVPARLSKNEFVFTAKAVRNAGDGDIRKGAKRMYQIMNQLEARA